MTSDSDGSSDTAYPCSTRTRASPLHPQDSWDIPTIQSGPSCPFPLAGLLEHLLWSNQRHIITSCWRVLLPAHPRPVSTGTTPVLDSPYRTESKRITLRSPSGSSTVVLWISWVALSTSNVIDRNAPSPDLLFRTTSCFFEPVPRVTSNSVMSFPAPNKNFIALNNCVPSTRPL